jgi:hypothetical protein
MPTIAQGVEFDTIAREWRCKWSADNDKASLVEAQKAIDSILAEVKALDGCKSVQRVVCGGCLDFKVRSLLLYIFCFLIANKCDSSYSDTRISSVMFFRLLWP